MFRGLLETYITFLVNLLNIMIVFRFFKFDTVKEILKRRCQIYNLMKKMIILRKIQFEPEQKKTGGNESHEKESKHIHPSVAYYYILEQEIQIGANANIAKTKREKYIVFVLERWIQCLLIWLKSQSARDLPDYQSNVLVLFI